MKRTHLLTIGVVLLAALAIYDLVTGWPAHSGYLGLAAVLAMFAAAVALYVATLVAGVRERKQEHGLGQAAGGIRWGALSAIGLAVLIFANCSSSVSGGPGNLTANHDLAGFLGLSAWVFAPLLLSLALPAVLVTAAAGTNHKTAIRLARLATWAAGAIVLVVLATAIGGFYAGIGECVFGASAGVCAAGFGSLANVFSLGALALLLPHIGKASAALETS